MKNTPHAPDIHARYDMLPLCVRLPALMTAQKDLMNGAPNQHLRDDHIRRLTHRIQRKRQCAAAPHDITDITDMQRELTAIITAARRMRPE